MVHIVDDACACFVSGYGRTYAISSIDNTSYSFFPSVTRLSSV